jgi:hypothetical protein
MALKDLYFIDTLDYNSAMDIVIKNHYLHRKAPCSKAFGLFCKFTNRVVGVVVYGVSCSSTLLKGICGPEESSNVYELTRLWIEDGTPKNTESFLIGNSIKKLDKEIIVSFAEIQQGHNGTVYQATNFLYCGLSAKFRDPKVKGLEHQHHATYANRMTMQEVKDKYGEENVYYVDRPRKHRYIYFNASGKRKQELLNKLKYPVLSYPKSVGFLYQQLTRLQSLPVAEIQANQHENKETHYK